MFAADCLVAPHRLGILLLLLSGTAGSSAPAAEPSSPLGVDACLAAQGLAERLLGERADRFTFEYIAPDQGRDVFELETLEGRTVVRGNSGVAMAMGLNWYLKHHCLCHYSWCGRQMALPDPLPPLPSKVREVSWARHRYFLNYCAFGYSLPWYDWDQWERLIDWMALNGINMPLSVTGQEAVWQAVCRRLGMSDQEITQFLAGPPYLPFQWMGCLDGWGGPLPIDWIAEHETLGKMILARQRQFGMTPVLQGFTGHVPQAVARLFPDATLYRIRWIDWETSLLDPLDPRFAKIATMWMEEQQKRFGTSHLYAADTFIEMLPPSGETQDLANLGRAIYAGLAAHDPQAVWVLQTWIFLNQKAFWTQPRIEAFLGSVERDQMLCLDLACENMPQWSRTEGFCGKPWLWCNIQNYGCTVSLGGSLKGINTDLPAARTDPLGTGLVGLGFVNEGNDYNPVVYDLMFEMAWRQGPVDLEAWIADYAACRYGKRDPRAEEAWKLLLTTVYDGPTRTSSVIEHVPSLTARSGGASYSNLRLADAWRTLQAASGKLGAGDAYQFDLVNLARQVLANHAGRLHAEVVKAHKAGDLAAYDAAVEQYLRLIGDLDKLLGTRSEFLLGKWLADARRWGQTDAEKARMEWNARRVITLWGDGTAINDYARKQWSGMLGGFYGRRWQTYLAAQRKALETGKPVDEEAFRQELHQWMAAWSDEPSTCITNLKDREVLHKDPRPAGADHLNSSGSSRWLAALPPYVDTPSGDAVALAGELWARYSGQFTPDAVSLTTGKPATCSHALPAYPAHLANDGYASDPGSFWATDVQQHPEPAWWQVDLESPVTVGRVVVVGYYGDPRNYGFTVETSLDGQTWTTVAARRDNREPATAEGYTCTFTPRPVRYLRVTETHNSANSGRHLVEVMAFDK
ncbi:MAG: alpha-N-acetylglucosaminidase TIM-barrel domain-containing protein [Thermoguttaceae bacterium]